MATPDTETLNVPLIPDVQEYVTTTEVARLDVPLHDAIARAEANCIAETRRKAVIVKIVPDGATLSGGSTTISWDLATAGWFLRGPDAGPPRGESLLRLTDWMTRMGREANTNQTITSVIILVNPV